MISLALPDLSRLRVDTRPLGVSVWALLRTVALAILGNYLIAVATLSLVLLSASSFSPVAALVSALPAWLAMHQIPLVIAGAPLGVLPLSPTLVSLLVIAASVNWLVRKEGLAGPRHAGVVLAAMCAAHAFVALVLSLMLGGVVSVSPAKALLYSVLVAGVGSGLGMFRSSGLFQFLRVRSGRHARSLRIATITVLSILAASTVLVLAALLMGLSEVPPMFDTQGSVVGLTLLSLAYLPNSIIAGASFLVGSQLSLGTIAVSPFTTEPGAVPAIPLLAAFPNGVAAHWWSLVLVVPLAIGVAAGWYCHRGAVSSGYASMRHQLAAVLVVATAAAAAMFVLGIATTGELGRGEWTPVLVSPGAALFTFGWISVPGAMTVFLCRWWSASAVDDGSVVNEAESAESEAEVDVVDASEDSSESTVASAEDSNEDGVEDKLDDQATEEVREESVSDEPDKGTDDDDGPSGGGDEESAEDSEERLDRTHEAPHSKISG